MAGDRGGMMSTWLESFDSGPTLVFVVQRAADRLDGVMIADFAVGLGAEADEIRQFEGKGAFGGVYRCRRRPVMGPGRSRGTDSGLRPYGCV